MAKRRKLNGKLKPYRSSEGPGRPDDGPGKASVGPRTRALKLLTLDHLDKRTSAYKHTRSFITRLEADLANDCTTAEKAIIRNAAILDAMIEHRAARYVAGKRIELNELFAAMNAQRRLLLSIGLERRARDVTPRLSDIIDGHAEVVE